MHIISIIIRKIFKEESISLLVIIDTVYLFFYHILLPSSCTIKSNLILCCNQIWCHTSFLSSSWLTMIPFQLALITTKWKGKKKKKKELFFTILQRYGFTYRVSDQRKNFRIVENVISITRLVIIKHNSPLYLSKAVTCGSSEFYNVLKAPIMHLHNYLIQYT